MILTVICSWCKKVMRKGDQEPGAPVSHGCCRACAQKHFPLVYDEIKDSIVEDVEDGNRV